MAAEDLITFYVTLVTGQVVTLQAKGWRTNDGKLTVYMWREPDDREDPIAIFAKGAWLYLSEVQP